MKLCAAEPSNAIVRASTSEDPPSDVRRRMMSDYDVTLTDEDNPHDLYVMFHGPNESAYEGGTWRVHVELPEGYPYKSPSIGFCNRMFHPNVDEMSGTVCLDVINQTWSPMFGAPRDCARRRPARRARATRRAQTC